MSEQSSETGVTASAQIPHSHRDLLLGVHLAAVAIRH